MNQHRGFESSKKLSKFLYSTQSQMTLNTFKSEVRNEFFDLIDFWMEYSIDEKHGGFLGTIDKDNKPVYSSKSMVSTSRTLWGFSTAIHFIKTQPELNSESHLIPELEKLCLRAFDYITEHFWDEKNGGVYWSLTAEGQPENAKKSMYSHSFFVYGMSEYYRATGYTPALEWARKGFESIIDHAYDQKNGGYLEGFAQDWSDTDDYILSKGELRKSMNTHLHLLECFANLYRVDRSEKVRFHLEHCLQIMLDKIIGKDKTRMTLFFTEDWQPRDQTISYGHDIEASWLVLEAAEILGDEHYIETVKTKCLAMAKDAADGLQPDHGMIYEINPETGHGNFSRDWWVMAEAMVGFYNAYQLSGKVHFLEKSENSWQFIKDYLMAENGEWWGGVNVDHNITSFSKGNPWKAPYHNVRSCMEIYRRIG